MAVYISDYEDCIQLLLNCDQKEYKQRESHLDEHITLLEKGDEKSPWYRFCKAGVYLRWAIINVRFGEQLSAANNFRKSFGLLRENQRLHPDFVYNNTFAGLEEAVVGSLPGSYKWLASLFGMRGNVKKGTEKLGAFISSHTANDLMYGETVLYYLYTRFYLLQEQKEVWDFLADPNFSTKNNLLNSYVKANLALDYRKADAALETLRSAAKDPNYSSYPVFDYQMGAALLSKSDTSCTYYFMQYLKKNKSDLYIKDCWQKMAFAWYIAGNMQKAQYCRRQIKPHGAERIDADKQAQKFAESNRWPNVHLLHARLLIEGGYHNDALAILNTVKVASLVGTADEAEYYFRMGRIYEELENYTIALQQYQGAIKAGQGKHEQFAARAALHMGKVYERAGKYAQAQKSYEECLDMPEHDFQNSIDQQAKAGINRVEVRN
ncbi:MAG: hypothetical protein K0Q79_2462 [Flavipsychrobacter sp.]|nr:hypothetical protein [Flavipsychrobacter sp.]